MRYAVGAVGVLLLVGLAWWLIGGAPNLRDPFRKQAVQDLVADTLRLHSRNLEAQVRALTAENTLTTEREASARSVQQFSENLASGLALVSQAVGAMSSAERKHAADLATLRIGMTLPTTERDTDVNTVVATFGARLKVYEDSLPVLIKGLSDANAQIQTLNRDMGDMRDRMGRQSKGIADARTHAQGRVSTLSKGLGKLFNAGKIKSYSDMDKQLMKVQEEQ